MIGKRKGSNESVVISNSKTKRKKKIMRIEIYVSRRVGGL